MAKSPEAFRSISEAADELGVPQHVLRFWETRFSFIRPMKRAGGRRFYRPNDIALLAAVRRLLHDDGYTIKGVQKLHRQKGAKGFLGGEANAKDEDAPPADVGAEQSEAPLSRLRETLAELERAKAELDRLLESGGP